MKILQQAQEMQGRFQKLQEELQQQTVKASSGGGMVTVEANGHLTFPPRAPARLARIQRLHAGLSLNYAAIGLVMELLDRIDDLERRLRTHPFLDSEGT